MSTKLEALIQRHRLAVEDFRRASRRGCCIEEDRAFDEETAALRALLLYAPFTMDEARRRSLYLLTTRFADDLTTEGRLFLVSFTRWEG